MQTPYDDLFSLLYGDLAGWDGSTESLRSYFRSMPSDEVLDRLVSGYGLQPQDESRTSRSVSTQGMGGTQQLADQVQALNQQLAEQSRTLEAARKRANTLSETLGQQQGEMRKANGIIHQQREAIQRHKGQARSAEKALAAERDKVDRLTKQLDDQTTRLEEREATLARLEQQEKDLRQRIEDKDDSYTKLRRQYRELEDEHKTLIHELEEQTDRYTKQKRAILDAQLQDTLRRWVRASSEHDSSYAGHQQALQADETIDGLRAMMEATTTGFQKDLADLRGALQAFETTRNALRKDLDLWQQGLYAARYDRLALNLQLFDTEIWRLMEQRLVRAASGNTPITQIGTDESTLVERLQMLSENLKASCECFGLRFFYPAQDEPLDRIRHQVFGSSLPAGDALVDACVSAGIELETSDGGRALIRPALVALKV